MKVTFLGATETVTGSNFLVEAAGKKFLVDCGLHQGKYEEELLNEQAFDYDVNSIDFMLLTHAHIDHSGRIPKLYKEGYRKPIYATKATCDLCSIMLPDSGHIQETENEIKNKKRKRNGKKPIDPLYTVEDAENCMELFNPVQYDQIINVDENINVRFNDAGHMLGSSIIEIWVKEDGKEEKVVFSGDIGNNDIPLLSSPTMIDSADYLVMESTYGDRLHLRNDEKASMFLDIVSETIENGGTVVIPSFAVGRTQEILYEIDKIKDIRGNDEAFKKEYDTLMKTKVYVDSPLATSATEVFEKNMNLFKPEIQEFIKRGDNPLDFPGLTFTKTVEESKALNMSDEPCIIISASGMCDVGRIKHHLKHNIWNPKSTILFVGYQAPGTLGRRIVDGQKKVRILGEEFAVKARIEYIEGYSGHADQEWLLNFVYSFRNKRPKAIFLVHGEPHAQNELKDKIEQNVGTKVLIPKYGDKIELNEKLTQCKACENPVDKQKQRIEIINRMQELEDEIEDMKHNLKDHINLSSNADIDMDRLNNRVNELRKQIIEIMNEN